MPLNGVLFFLDVNTSPWHSTSRGCKCWRYHGIDFCFVFLLLPIAKSISIGKLITFEREVAKIHREVDEFKSNMRQFMDVQTNLMSTISNTVNHSVVVNLPSKYETAQAYEGIIATHGQKVDNGDRGTKVEEYIRQAGGDHQYALARLRMDIERSLRIILDIRPDTYDTTITSRPFYSVRRLFNIFFERYPQYKNLESSAEYLIKICNSAIHGQNIPPDYAYESIDIGLRVLEILQLMMDDDRQSGTSN